MKVGWLILRTSGWWILVHKIPCNVSAMKGHYKFEADHHKGASEQTIQWKQLHMHQVLNNQELLITSFTFKGFNRLVANNSKTWIHIPEHRINVKVSPYTLHLGVSISVITALQPTFQGTLVNLPKAGPKVRNFLLSYLSTQWNHPWWNDDGFNFIKESLISKT